MDTRIKVGLIALLFVAGAAGGAALQAGFIPVSQNDSGLPVNVPGGPSATVTGNFDFSNQTGAVDDSTLQYNTSAGSALFESSGDANATLPVSSLDGSWVNLSDVDTTGADLTVRTGEVAPATISGEVTELRYPEASRIDTTDDEPDIYLAASGSGQITLNNLPASTELTAVTTDSGQTLDQVTTDSSGSATFDVASTSGREGVILFTNHAPSASDLAPDDGVKLQERGTNFSVDVSDPEFPTAQGDVVTAELLVDGSVVASRTASSNRTVSVTHELTEGGQHTYQWRLTDSYGSTTTTSQRTLSVPSTLEVRSVANQSLVNAENATITFYGGPNERDIVERPVENGEVSLTDLPANTEFTVVVRADGYYTRTAVIPSLYDQSITWLLPKNNTDAVEVVFQLDDRTGDFAGSDSTQLRVQRAVEYNNSTQWYDVVGDDISATSQLATILENQQRYRLIVSNEQQTRILGSYSTSGPADPEIIPIGRIEFSGETDAGVSLDAKLLNETQPAIRIMAFNPDRTADRLVYRVVNTTTENDSTIIANTTISDPKSFAAVSAPLTDVDSVKGQTYRVDVWAYNGSQVVAHSSTSVGKLQGFGLSGILNQGVMTLGGYVFLIAGTYGTANYSPRLGALMGVIIGGALTIYGILSIPHVVLGYAGSIAVIRQVATEG